VIGRLLARFFGSRLFVVTLPCGCRLLPNGHQPCAEHAEPTR
jgi:hypothetical protein